MSNLWAIPKWEFNIFKSLNWRVNSYYTLCIPNCFCNNQLSLFCLIETVDWICNFVSFKIICSYHTQFHYLSTLVISAYYFLLFFQVSLSYIYFFLSSQTEVFLLLTRKVKLKKKIRAKVLEVLRGQWIKLIHIF